MKISVIGAAGNVGSCAAFNIAIHNIADELVMIDSYSPDRLEQYASDLTSAVTGLDTAVRAGGEEDMRDSDIIVIAAGSAQIMNSRIEALPQNLPIIHGFARQIKQYSPESIVMIATNPVDPLNYAIYLSTGFSRRRLIGYSINDSTRFRMSVARVLGVKSSQVKAMVIGEHGNSQVLLFSSLRIDGQPLTLDDDARQKVRQEAAALSKVLEPQRIKTGRTAAWTTSMGLAGLCQAIGRDTRETLPCSAVLDGEYGCRNMSFAVPAVIGRNGILEIQEWKLQPDEREALQRSANTLNPTMRYVEDFIKEKG
jgi:malate dehydrogenase